MNHSAPLRDRAARLRAFCTRAGTVLGALLALGMFPALAAAQRHAHGHRAHRHHHHGRAHHRRHHARHRASTVHHGRRHRTHTDRHRTSHRSAHPATRVVHAATCPGAHARIGHVSRTITERATVCLLDVQRADHGLPALVANSRLEVSAQRWTNTMVHDRSFGHGSDFGARISAVGFNWSRIGENIADGYRTPKGAVTAWMHSLGHCQNILDPEFREVGTGFDTGSAESGDWRSGTWTLDLALRMGQHPRSVDFTPAEHCPY